MPTPSDRNPAAAPSGRGHPSGSAVPSAFDNALFQGERWLEAEIYAAKHGDDRRLAHYDAFARFMRVVDTPQKLSAWRQSGRTLPVDAPTPDAEGRVTR